MKDKGDFPLFEDLQLGPVGDVDGCGCLATKIDEVERNLDIPVFLLEGKVYEELGGAEFWRLIDENCPNTVPNRRKAYDALVRATESFGYEVV